ncbi:MAG: polymer-forming cytoskeletal protein [Acidobacteriia bacterium]|nr:polymer-forming cytoskeletal protein [Terriglobia bacterium]
MARDTDAVTQDPRQAATATVIGRQTRIEGTITGGGAVRVDGGLKGAVHLEAPLEIVQGASVEAEVQATVVRVAGSVTGNVTATQLVELLATAVVKGDVSAPALHVVQGAKLDGRVVMKTDRVPEAEIPKNR